MKKYLVPLVALFVMLSLGTQLDAQQKFPPNQFDLLYILRPPTRAEMDTLADRLTLTDEQKRDMDSKYQKYNSEIRTLINKYPQAQQDLITALQRRPNPDPGQVEDALRELDRIQSSLLDKEMELWNALSDNLRQDQTEEFWRLFGKDRLEAIQQPTPYRY